MIFPVDLPTLGKSIFFVQIAMVYNEESYIKQLKVRRRYYDNHLPKIRQAANPKEDLPNTCPSCGYPSLNERNSWDTCSICWWEDDGQDDRNENDSSGPNGGLSLSDYRITFYNRLKSLRSSESNAINTRLSEKELNTIIELYNQLELLEASFMNNEVSILALKELIKIFDVKNDLTSKLLLPKHQ